MLTEKWKEQHSRSFFFLRTRVLNPAAPMEAAPSETEKEGGCAETVAG